MILCDRDIVDAMRFGLIGITPFDTTKDLQPASVDLHLGDEFLYFEEDFQVIDPAIPNKMKSVKVVDHEFYDSKMYVINANKLYLAATTERIYVGPNIVARVEGKSSLGRLGLMVHVTAGFIDPGFDGNITLELVATNDTVLYPGMPICQISFMQMSGEAMRPYGENALKSKYQGSIGPVESKYWKNFKR